MKRQFDEIQLVALLKMNDKAAFKYLYDHYSGALYNVICKIIKNDPVAAEVLQDTFLKIWKSIGTYDPSRGSLFTWMLNIARNRAIDMHRANSREVHFVDIDSLQSDNEIYSFAVLPLFDLHDIHHLVAQLHPEQRSLIDLVYIQGFTHQEVSRMLLMPLGTIKSRIRKALSSLRSSLHVPQTAVS